MRLGLFWITCVISIIGYSEQALAAPKGAIDIDSSDIFETDSAGRTYTCAFVNGRWTAGRLIDSDTFLSYKSEINNTKAAMKKAKGKKHATLAAKVDKLSLNSKRGGAACRDGPPDDDGDDDDETPTPTPKPTPTSAPTGNFDSNGNVTNTGKAVFGIPSSLSANTTSGRAIWSVQCTSCHGEKLGKSYSQIKSAVANPPMDYIRLSDQDFAHVTAFLNRFRLN